MKNRFWIGILLPLLFSCSKRNLSYFGNYDAEGILTEPIEVEIKEPIIQPGDLLEITVTSLNPEAAVPFNRVSQITFDENNSRGSSETPSNGYLVDSYGIIDFPVLGRIKLGGLSKFQAKLNLTSLLTNYLGDPTVSIRYLNYRVTVIGEVNRPNTFLVPSERINVLEAIGMAGDLTVYGKRENVMVIHESQGTRTIAHLNLNEKEVLNSPYFYLRPNDVVYVEPLKTKRDQASLTRSNISLFLAVVTAASLVALNIR